MSSDKLIAQANPLGRIQPPGTSLGTDPGAAIGKVIQLAIYLIIIGGAIYALFNLLLAGYSFMSAGGDAKKIADMIY